ncbi:holo-ACP synthase [Vibrio quintilis]|uniref:Holo-[acyl-carrier-protein] synthase n=1 Tax=Vibrio quintilis TaxID=1117707 RepID=A0A1M7YWX3_9VIBR|nr:holo-ACP synthase [Vibrio quintilis]SHO57121.1 Holo-[acyl-carrier-protein] synthase [Vibrio quintilis]
MAVTGFGTDIVEIDRIKQVVSRAGDSFARRILTDAEMLDYEKSKSPERFLAKRFAAKEAASKALGTGIARGVTFHDFTVSHDDLGKPVLNLSGTAASLAESQQVNSVFLSISDERNYAVASVIFESSVPGHSL